MYNELTVGEMAEILAWKLRGKWQAKPEFSPKPLSNPHRPNPCQSGHECHYKVMNLIKTTGLGSESEDLSSQPCSMLLVGTVDYICKERPCKSY